MTRQLITAEHVAAEHAKGVRCIAAPAGRAVISPAAWSKAHELGVTFDRQATAANATAAGGVVLVKGDGVELPRFDGAGPGRNVGLLDVITAKHGSPMSAGFMAWSKADSFAWHLDYDEVDYVVEGTLHLGIDGRVVEGKPGDVLYIPKGSSVVFGTPTRVRLFYVTYPANWAAPG